jgi:hypothetical protein
LEQLRRIFCHLEVIVNEDDSWTEDILRREMKLISRWEWKGKTVYPDWRTTSSKHNLGLKTAGGMSAEERRERKVAYRKMKDDETKMVDLMGSFGVQENQGGAAFHAPLQVVSAPRDEAAEAAEKLNSMEL